MDGIYGQILAEDRKKGLRDFAGCTVAVGTG
jgi:hypothetical protein